MAVRKTVTALFCDLVGSTAFEEQVDPESARETLGRYHRLARECIEEHGGTVAKFIGDGVMALFGVPEVAEDDADRAVRTGMALQQRFSAIRDHIANRHGLAVGLRVGINTGEVVTAATDDDIVGDALNTAARLEGACTPGEVLVGEETWRLTRSAIDFDERGEIAAKGKGAPVRSYVATSLTDVDHRSVTPFVGRAEELRRLQVVIDETVLQRAARLVTIIGAPGVGKTRLARELRSSIEGGTRAFELRCERTGTATFTPIVELLHSLGAIEGLRDVLSNTPDAERIVSILSGLLGSEPMRPTEEVFLGVRRLFEVLGSVQPVVLVVDDVQWAEPLLLDLLDHLAEWVTGIPLLVVCLARPEIRELRPTLAEPGKRVAAVVSLDGLTAGETAELAARLLGVDAVPVELAERIPDSTQGNPLFVRELVRMLVDDGIVTSQDGTWTLTVPVEEIDVPPTVHSLLASRLERMPDDERTVLEHASVVGQEFPVGAVAAALEAPASSFTAQLDRLRRKELVEPTGTYWGDEPVYRFHHVLIRDAAYRRLLKASRADLHVRVGDWTERAAATLIGEHEVVIGNQFEQAYLLRTELDLDDDETSALCQRAAGLFETAAARALERDDLAAASSLAKRAMDCSGDEPRTLIVACEAALGSGEVAAGRSLVERLEVAAGTDERLLAWLDCFRVELTVFTDPGGLADAERLASEAAERLEALNDLAGVAKARLQCAAVLVRLGRVGECERQLDLALTAARAVDDRRRITAVLGAAPIAALWGPSPVARAGGRCLDVVRLLRITTASPAVEATSVRCQAVLEALRGRFETARTMLETARATVEELGLERGLLETDLYAGLVELYADDAATAEPFLRSAYEGLGQLGIGADAGQAAAYLARALLLQGRLDEADDLAAESDALAGQNPQSAIVSRSVQAEILSARGPDDAAAIELAEEAVSYAAGSDILIDHAQALGALSRVRTAAGDTDGAADAAREADLLYDLKGATLRSTTPAQPIGQPAPTEPTTRGFKAGTESGPVAHGRQPPPDALGSTGAAYRNTADRVSAHAGEAFFTGRMEDVIALQTDNIEFEDRRTGLAVQTTGTEDFQTLWQANAHDDPPTFHYETLATRGDHLVLKRGRTQGRTAAGNPAGTVDYEYEWLAIDRTNESGLRDLNLLFDVDALHEAVDELDRLWLDSLPLGQRAALRGLFAFTHMLGHGEPDWIRPFYHRDVEITDHRAASYGTSGLDEMMQRHAELPALGDAVAYLVVEPEGDAMGGLFHQCIEIDNEGARSIIEHHGVGTAHPDEGRALRTEMWETAADARVSFEQLDGAVERIPRWNPAALQAMAAPLYLQIPTHAWPSYADLDRLRDALDSNEPQPFHDSQRVIATRGEQFALVETPTDFVVVEIDEQGTLIDWELFGSALSVALDHLDDRVSAVLPGLPILAGATYARGIRRQDQALVDSVAAPDLVMIDRRLAYLPDNAAAEIVEALSPLGDDGSFPITLEVLESTPATSLVRMALMRDEFGHRLDEFPGIGLTHVTDGKVVVAEIFSIDDLEVARTRFDELAGSMRAFRNDAERVASAASMHAFSGDLESCLELLSDDTVMEDRRPLLAARIEGKAQFRDQWSPRASSEWRSVEFETLATRGDGLVLRRAAAGEFKHGWIEIDRLDAAGLRDLHVVFDPADLRSAVEELDRLYVESLPLDERWSCVIAFAIHHSISLGRDEWMQAWYHPDVEAIDHRPIGFEPLSGNELAARNSAVASTMLLAVEPSIEGRHGLFRHRIEFGEAASEYWVEFFGASTLDARDGRVLRNEHFDDHAMASERYDALCNEPTMTPAWNAAFRASVCASAFAQIPPGSWPSYAGMDRLREAIEANEPHPFDGSHRLVATRGERVALIETSTDFVVVELDATGILVDWQAFDTRLRHALDDLDTRTARLNRANPLAATYLFSKGIRHHDQRLIDEATHPDLVMVDHRPAVLPHLPRAHIIDFLQPLGDDESFTAVIEVLAASPAVGLSRVALARDALEIEFTELAALSVAAVAGGQIVTLELFPVEAEVAARERFAELSATAPAPSHWNRADELAQATIVAGLGGGVDNYMSLQADAIVFADHRPMLRTSFEGKAAMLDYFEAAMANEWERYDHETVAVRGDDLSLHHINGAITGQEYDWYILQRFDGGGLCDLAEMFAEDQLVEAVARIDELYLDSASILTARTFAPFIDIHRVATTGTPEQFRARFKEEFIAIDHRHGVWPDLDLDGWVARIRSVRKVGVTATGVWQQVVDIERGNPVAGRQAFEFRHPDGSKTVSKLALAIHADPGSGLGTRMDIFEGDQIDQAIACCEAARQGVGPNLLVASGGQLNVHLRARESTDHLIDRALLDRPHPYGVETRNIIAVRGDCLAWFEVQLRDGTWVFSIEECDPDGRITDWRLFDADQRTDAALCFFDRNAALHEVDEVGVAAGMFARANLAWDRDLMDHALHHDYRAVDHRRLGFDGAGKKEVLRRIAEMQPTGTLPITTEILAAADTVLVGPGGLLDGDAGALSYGREGFKVISSKDGRVHSTDEYDTLEEAMARFHELTADS